MCARGRREREMGRGRKRNGRRRRRKLLQEKSDAAGSEGENQQEYQKKEEVEEGGGGGGGEGQQCGCNTGTLESEEDDEDKEKRTEEGLFAMLPDDIREKIYTYVAFYVDKSGASVLALRATCTSMRARFNVDHAEIKWRKMVDSTPFRTVWFNRYTREYEERESIHPEATLLKITSTLDALSNQGAVSAPLLGRVVEYYAYSDFQYVRWAAVHFCRTVVYDAIQKQQFDVIADAQAIRRLIVNALRDEFWQVKKEALESAFYFMGSPMCILREDGAMDGAWHVVKVARERRESEATSICQRVMSLQRARNKMLTKEMKEMLRRRIRSPSVT